MTLFQGIGNVIRGVALGFAALTGIFLILQVAFLKQPRSYVVRILIGVGLSAAGIVLFLQGVGASFLPAGRSIGETLGNTGNLWLMLAVGLVIGFLAAFSEPSVRVLASQVETSSGGYIPGRIVLYAISAGVSMSLIMGVIRTFFGLPVLYFIVPCYIIALLLIPFAERSFVPVAFDAGGVATGPMPAIITTAIMIGVISVMPGRDLVTDSFGLVALMVIAPVISILLMGVAYRLALHRKKGE